MIKASSVDDYIKAFPPIHQRLLNQMRDIVKYVCPEANESINYGMPAYKYLGKPLVYFGAFEKHIGFYATPSANIAFTKKLSIYKMGKGSIQFPIGKSLPIDLIKEMISYKMREILNNQSK